MRLELLAPSTVTVTARGEIELALRLDDARGQRLERAVGGVEGVRLVRSLAAGTYFLRLAGQDGAEGTYQLRIQNRTPLTPIPLNPTPTSPLLRL